jgi:hypothetical protein
MEVTKWLKPSISVSRIGDSASVQAATRVNAEQALHGVFEVKHRRPLPALRLHSLDVQIGGFIKLLVPTL